MNMVKKIIIVNAILSFLVIAVLIFTFFKFERFLNTPATNKHTQVYVQIRKGENVHDIIDRLKNKGLITRSDWFYYYVRLEGAGKKIKAGLHLFYSDYTPREVLKELISPKVYVAKITVLPGYNLNQIANMLTQKGFDGEMVLKLEDSESFSKFCTGFDAKSLEGFLYPNTYFISKDDKISSILLYMCAEFKKEFRRLTGRNKFTGSDYKKLIIASIIQKEATNKKDMRLVASVIYNRLKKGMYLQMDSTTFNDKFNTYKHKGLPPQPICNPGYDALYAAYHPLKSDYLYFISKKDGSMLFSKTLKQHNRNIREFLK